MILLRSLTDLWVLHSHPTIYAYVYWYVTEPVSASLGSLVIFELYRRVLELYPGVARLARKLIAVIFALVLSRFLVHAVFSQQSNAGVNVLILLRDLRIVQSAFLVGIILLVRHYGIAIGKNLAGMIGGYGVYMGLGLLDITLRAYLGDSVQAWWAYIHQSCYLLVLGVWCWSLWCPASLLVKYGGPLESDYRLLVERTVTQLDRVYNYLWKSVSP